MSAGKRKYDEIENLTDGNPATLGIVEQGGGPLKKICGVRGIGGVTTSIVDNTLLIDGHGAPGIVEITAGDGITCTPDPILDVGTVAVTNPLPPPASGFINDILSLSDTIPRLPQWVIPLWYSYNIQVDAGTSPPAGYAYVASLSGFTTMYFNAFDARGISSASLWDAMVQWSAGGGSAFPNMTVMMGDPVNTSTLNVSSGIPASVGPDVYELTNLGPLTLASAGRTRVMFIPNPYQQFAPRTYNFINTTATNPGQGEMFYDDLTGNVYINSVDATGALTYGFRILSQEGRSSMYIRYTNSSQPGPTVLPFQFNTVYTTGNVYKLEVYAGYFSGQPDQVVYLQADATGTTKQFVPIQYNFINTAATNPGAGDMFYDDGTSTIYIRDVDATLFSVPAFAILASQGGTAALIVRYTNSIFDPSTTYMFTCLVTSMGAGVYRLTSLSGGSFSGQPDQMVYLQFVANSYVPPPVANNTVMGNVSGVSAAPTALSATQATGVLDSFAGTVKGLVPTGSGASTSVFLRGDGSWNTPPGTYTPPAVANNTLMGNNSGGSAAPTALTGTQATALLDTVTSGAKGLAPASGGGTSNFLRADGSWAVPPGSGGTSIYQDGGLYVAAIIGTSVPTSAAALTVAGEPGTHTDPNGFVTYSAGNPGVLTINTTGNYYVYFGFKGFCDNGGGAARLLTLDVAKNGTNVGFWQSSMQFSIPSSSTRTNIYSITALFLALNATDTLTLRWVASGSGLVGGNPNSFALIGANKMN
jgi:hypothetical protein